MSADPMTLRQAPNVPTPLILKAVIVVHFVFAAYLINRDVFSHGPFAALPMIAALLVGFLLYLQPGRHARLTATALSGIWLFVGYGALCAAPILIALWAVPKVRAYLAYADEYRDTYITYRVVP